MDRTFRKDGDHERKNIVLGKRRFIGLNRWNYPERRKRWRGILYGDRVDSKKSQEGKIIKKKKEKNQNRNTSEVRWFIQKESTQKCVSDLKGGGGG